MAPHRLLHYPTETQYGSVQKAGVSVSDREWHLFVRRSSGNHYGGLGKDVPEERSQSRRDQPGVPNDICSSLG